MPNLILLLLDCNCDLQIPLIGWRPLRLLMVDRLGYDQLISKNGRNWSSNRRSICPNPPLTPLSATPVYYQVKTRSFWYRQEALKLFISFRQKKRAIIWRLKRESHFQVIVQFVGPILVTWSLTKTTNQFCCHYATSKLGR